MKKPNYSHEKRQRELAKQKKKEEKRLAKARQKNADEEEAATPGGESDSESVPVARE